MRRVPSRDATPCRPESSGRPARRGQTAPSSAGKPLLRRRRRPRCRCPDPLGLASRSTSRTQPPTIERAAAGVARRQRARSRITAGAVRHRSRVDYRVAASASDPVIALPARSGRDRLRQSVARRQARAARPTSLDGLPSELEAIGLRVEVTEVAPGRPNVVGVLDGRAPGRSLMFCGHTDTVGVSGMAAAVRARDPRRPPLRPRRAGHEGRRRRDDRRRAPARRERWTRAGRVIVAAVVDEEHASSAPTRSSRRGAPTPPWSPSRPVSTSRLRTRAFSGSRRDARPRGAWQPPARGPRRDSAHGPRARRGSRRSTASAAGAVHPLLGTASLHASLIEGGHELSSYPARAALQYERRTLPGERPMSRASKPTRSSPT